MGYKLSGNQDGFTFLDVIGASMMIAVGFVAILEMFIAVNNFTKQSSDRLTASKFTQSYVDNVRTQGYDLYSALIGTLSIGAPSSLPGTMGNCNTRTGKYGCVTVAQYDATTLKVDVVVGYVEGNSQKSVTQTSYVSKNGIGYNQNAQLFFFDGEAGVGYTSTWSNPTRLYDSNDVSYASTASNYAEVVNVCGTSAPATGSTGISGVKAKVYGYIVGSTGQINADIYTSGFGQKLGSVLWNTNFSTSSTPGWSTSWDISPPPGGWTWSAVNSLCVQVYATRLVGSPNAINVGKVQIQVYQ